MIILGLLCLLALAALFGFFFLIFKIGFILFKKAGNKWPLILAGASTLLICLWTVYAMYSTYRRFAKPFTPILQAIQTQTAPTFGSHIYRDPRFGIQLALPNATVMSEWIDWQDISVLFGVDTNIFLKEAKEYPFTGFLLVRQILQTPPDAMDMATMLTTQLENMNSEHGRIEFTSQPRLIQLKNGATGALTNGLIYMESAPAPIPIAILVVTRGEEIYYFGGVSIPEEGVLTDTLTSLQLPAL